MGAGRAGDADAAAAAARGLRFWRHGGAGGAVVGSGRGIVRVELGGGLGGGGGRVGGGGGMDGIVRRVRTRGSGEIWWSGVSGGCGIGS